MIDRLEKGTLPPIEEYICGLQAQDLQNIMIVVNIIVVTVVASISAMR